jgi:AcrR family transcriptional regulator
MSTASSPTVPTRRERLRTATVTEIKQAARRLLVAGGPTAISLRAIARDMGMTAPAIYRYFPSLDALVLELTEDLYEEMREHTQAAGDEVPESDPVRRLAVLSRAFRHWSLAHPGEFALMFGNPVPGVSAFEDGCNDLDHPGARFGRPFLEAMTTLWHAKPFPTPPLEVIIERVGPQLTPYQRMVGEEIPLEVIYAYLSAWTRLYGMVAMEVFGHLQWALVSLEPLFELELAGFINQVAP